MIKSYSFCSKPEIQNWNKDKSVVSLDFVSSELTTPIIDSFPNLKRFRATFSNHLTEITFKNCPQLEAVDLSDCGRLQKVIFINSPQLRALDCSFSGKLTEIISDDLTHLQYLSVPGTCIKQLPVLPNILYLDLNMISNPWQFPFETSPLLEEFRISSQEIDINTIMSHEHLISAYFSYSTLTGECLTKAKSLQFLVLTSVSPQFKMNMKDMYCIMNGQEIGNFPKEIKKTTWKEAALLLYGPWGVPEVDKTASSIPKATISPPQINVEKASDAIAGALFGTAIMDMVGLGVEFYQTPRAKIALREPFNMVWTHPVMTQHTTPFLRGTPTDDTSQAILIMRSLVLAQQEKNKPNGENHFQAGNVYIDTGDFAQRIIEWNKYGHKEHKHPCGLGCGRTVRTVIIQKGYTDNPAHFAEDVWEKSGKKLAANGSVMRNVPCGCLCFWDESVVIEVSDRFSCTTHYDPRCRFSCICASLLQCRFIQKAAGLIDEVDIDKTIQDAIAHTPNINDYMDDVKKYTTAKTVEELELGEEKSIGYTLKALGSAIWCLRYATSFVDGMEKIIPEGGDSDTNGAVVGALLGAKFGYSQLPKETLILMHTNEWYYNEIRQFMALMGLEPPPRIWDV